MPAEQVIKGAIKRISLDFADAIEKLSQEIDESEQISVNVPETESIPQSHRNQTLDIEAIVQENRNLKKIHGKMRECLLKVKRSLQWLHDQQIKVDEFKKTLQQTKMDKNRLMIENLKLKELVRTLMAKRKANIKKLSALTASSQD